MISQIFTSAANYMVGLAYPHQRRSQVYCDGWNVKIVRTFELRIETRGCNFHVTVFEDSVSVLRKMLELDAQTRGRYLGCFHLMYGTSLLNDTRKLTDYGIASGSSIKLVYYFGLGGSSIPIIRGIKECNKVHWTELRDEKRPPKGSNALLEKFVSGDVTLSRSQKKNLLKRLSSYPMQADSETLDIARLLSTVRTTLKASLGKNSDETIKLIEDVLMLVCMISRSANRTDMAVAIVNFAKLRAKGSLICSVMNDRLLKRLDEVLGYDIQADGWLSQARLVLDNYTKVREMPIVKKLHKFSMYAMSLALFDSAGLNMDMMGYSKMEQEVLKAKYHKGPDFIHCVLDTLLFICERGYQCYVSNSLVPFLHSGSRYEKWFDKVEELKRKVLVLGNPEDMGFSYHSFIGDLEDAIEEGDNIVKFITKLEQIELRYIKSMLDHLKCIRMTTLSKRAAQKNRDAPFALMLHGPSKQGKTSVKQICISYFAKIRDLPDEDEYIHTRTFGDKNWSGFQANVWCIVFDDVASLNPSAAPAGDPSLLETIPVGNNTPYVTPQADLPDKGRIPCRPELIVGTTNIRNLNAHAYFACPLAILRRWKITVTVRAKPEYSTPEGFLDEDNLPETPEGEYSNFWTFQVRRVVPVKPANNEMDETECRDVTNPNEYFEDINLFLQFLGREALKHKKNQLNMRACTTNYRKAQVCKKCLLNIMLCKCDIPMSMQADVIQSSWYYAGLMLLKFLALCGLNWAFFYALFYIATFLYMVLRCFRISRRFAACFLGAADWATTTPYQALLIMRMTVNQVNSPRIMKQVGAAVGLILVWWKLSDFLKKSITKDAVKSCVASLTHPTESQVKESFGPQFVTKQHKINQKNADKFDQAVARVLHPVDEDGDPAEVDKEETWSPQGNELSVPDGKQPLPDENAKVDVWYRDSYEVTTFDTTPMSRSMAGLSRSEALRIIEKNCVYVDAGTKRSRAFCVGGSVYVMDSHCMPMDDSFMMSVVQAPLVEGISPNVNFLMTQAELHRIPERELVFFRIRHLPPKKSLVNLFYKPTFRGVLKGDYVSRDKDGQISVTPVNRIMMTPMNIELFDDNYECWSGIVENDTQKGLCGAVMISHSQNQLVILGIHLTGGRNNICGANPVDWDLARKMCDKLEPLMVQAGCPMLSAPSAPRALTSLNVKSPLRYIDQGHANVYGSFVGFRPASKSRVHPSIISPYLMRRGYTIKYFAPNMRGYVPWRTGLLDIVQGENKMDMSRLDRCVKAYTNDILRNIPKEELAKLHVYDLDTAVNGAPGVAYVDKIKRNTSMGAPWNKSKKFCMKRAEPRNGLQDPVDVDDEVIDRIDIMRAKYVRGERCYPIFTEHQKDDPMSKKKVLAQRNRLFSAAPVDFCILGRMYFLPIIRLIQNNKYVFEAAVGMVAQSAEWDQLYKYMTTFGKENLFAGDYSKFDKKMMAALILACFQVLINIAREAGWTHEQLLIMAGIAVDTAYPLIDFNGDLIEFFGSNPSGQIATVIINCVANSLYMRYAFEAIAQGKDLEYTLDDFQRLVHLITYGDDNALNVSSEIVQWFNHTAVADEMAKIGVVYTMADKEALSVPLIDIDHVSFLKRKWRFDEEIGKFVCPLEEESIEKMLMVTLTSKTVCEEEQTVSSINSAIREYFWYGREIYEGKRNMLMDVVEEAQLVDYTQTSTFPTWNALKKEFMSHTVPHIDFASGKRTPSN